VSRDGKTKVIRGSGKVLKKAKSVSEASETVKTKRKVARSGTNIEIEVPRVRLPDPEAGPSKGTRATKGKGKGLARGSRMTDEIEEDLRVAEAECRMLQSKVTLYLSMIDVLDERMRELTDELV
jgi:hypothetical protein